MNPVSHEERDRLLRIDPQLIEELRRMYSEGVSVSSLIDYLRAQDVPKAGAIIALRRAAIIDPNEAKRAVHFSEAYAYRREADEAFEESIVQAMEEIERSEAAA